jgi:hypothetical protein
MSYAIVGFGKIGQALAHAFARKNIDVTVASRRPPEALSSPCIPIAHSLLGPVPDTNRIRDLATNSVHRVHGIAPSFAQHHAQAGRMESQRSHSPATGFNVRRAFLRREKVDFGGATDPFDARLWVLGLGQSQRLWSAGTLGCPRYARCGGLDHHQYGVDDIRLTGWARMAVAGANPFPRESSYRRRRNLARRRSLARRHVDRSGRVAPKYDDSAAIR